MAGLRNVTNAQLIPSAVILTKMVMSYGKKSQFSQVMICLLQIAFVPIVIIIHYAFVVAQ